MEWLICHKPHGIGWCLNEIWEMWPQGVVKVIQALETVLTHNKSNILSNPINGTITTDIIWYKLFVNKTLSNSFGFAAINQLTQCSAMHFSNNILGLQLFLFILESTACTYTCKLYKRINLFWPTYCRSGGRRCCVSHTPKGSRYLGMLYFRDHWEAFWRPSYFTNISTNSICSSRSSATTLYI